MGKYFGTDGIRGIAGEELSYELALATGKGVSKVLTNTKDKKAKILIGKDTRESGDMLESALLEGITQEGAEGVSLGVVPTPAVAFLVKKYNADAGIMISASHNPYQFNGIKIFDRNGFKLPDETENEIEKIIDEELSSLTCNKHNNKEVYNSENIHSQAVNDYVNYVAGTVDEKINTNMKIAIDCSNGSASATAKQIFTLVGVDNLTFLNITPDGKNINESCGSTCIEKLAEYVVGNGYDLGIAFDGDADRCLMTDETGRIIDGDIILAICAKHLKNQNKLKNNTAVGTIMSNAGLKKFCDENSINLEETKVGDRYVLQRMLEGGFCVGAEQSGHMIFLDYSTTGDGELTAVQVLNIISNSGKKASEIRDLMKKYPQVLKTIDILPGQKGALKNNDKIQDYIKNLKEKIGNKGKAVIRESGTEPKIRVMIEHENTEMLNTLMEEAINNIKENL